MTKIEKVLDYLSKKEWNLRSDWKQVKKYLDENAEELEDIRSIKRYKFIFKEPLFFEHNLTTYSTGRIFAKYVLLPNKAILGKYLKELLVPEKDYFFASFDFSGSQMRHLAVYKNLEKVKEIFEKDLDIYTEFAKETGIHDRKLCKDIMLTLSFGGTKNTLKNNFPLDLTFEDIEKATKIYEEWFEIDVEDYQNNVKLSHTAQKLEADFMKEKLIKLYEKSGYEFRLHAMIHDDIVCEIHKNHIEKVEKIKKFLEKNDSIKMKVKTKISNSFQFK
jgi:DNA polymerase I-like protein with 3'-5' exonuclease and polymerase domains